MHVSKLWSGFGHICAVLLIASLIVFVVNVGLGKVLGHDPLVSASRAAITSNSYEAESSTNTLGGNAKVVSCSACSDGAKAGYLGNNNGTLQFNGMSASSTGTYTVTLYYIDGSSGRSVNMSVNGATAITIKTHGTNDNNWNFVQSLSIQINLNTSANTIKFFSPVWAADIDRIVISGGSSTPTITPTVPNTPAPPTPTPTTSAATATPTNISTGGITSYEAEASANTLGGSAAVASCSACSAGAKVGYLGNNSGTLQFNNVSVPTTGNYTLTFYYIDGSAGRAMSMSVNGAAATNFTTHGTNDNNWNFVQNMPLNVNLNAGANTIKFFNANYAADLDRISINAGVTPTPTNTPVAATATPTNTPVIPPTATSTPGGFSNGLAMTPPMGWNSWNHYQCNINEQLIRNQAQAIASSGMKDAGYIYINVDDCWMASSRDANGNLYGDPTRFPSGIKSLADYVHSLGLKFGIYEDAGTRTCKGYPGSYGYEQQDANTFASWGVDYLKYDWCNIPGSGMDYAKQRYTIMSNALKATGRPIVFSICTGWDSSTQPWLWAPQVGQLWRTTGDISDGWGSILQNLEAQVGLEKYAGPGHWNDPDMLEVGNPNMSQNPNQEMSQISLWSILAAPLIAGNDTTNMPVHVTNALLNKEVISIDQDPLGQQGTRITPIGTTEIWVRHLANGDVAIGLLNTNGSNTQQISVNTQDLGLPAATSYTVRDLWAHTTSTASTVITANVPVRGIAMFRVTPN